MAVSPRPSRCDSSSMWRIVSIVTPRRRDNFILEARVSVQLCSALNTPHYHANTVFTHNNTTLTHPSQILSSMQINFQNYTFKSYSVRLSVVLSVGCGCVKAVVMISGPIVTQSPGARQHQTRHSGHSRDSLLLPNYSSSAQPPHNSHHCPQLKTKLYALQILFQGVNCIEAEKLMNLLRSV